jgi:G3E family GTPase
MKFFKQSAAFVLGFLLMAGSVFAQGNPMQQKMQQTQADSITNEELKKFAAVTSDVNEKVDAEIVSLLADKEMDPQRFQEIMMKQRNPRSDSADVTEQEQKTIDEVQPKLMKVQQKEIMNAMEKNGLQPQRFQAIVQALQSNPEVVKRYRKITQEEQQKGETN